MQPERLTLETLAAWWKKIQGVRAPTLVCRAENLGELLASLLSGGSFRLTFVGTLVGERGDIEVFHTMVRIARIVVSPYAPDGVCQIDGPEAAVGSFLERRRGILEGDDGLSSDGGAGLRDSVSSETGGGQKAVCPEVGG